ncbi:MAG: type II toxin-antitoxin system HicA family toxin [Egibacteraceae bacterium]
MKVLQRAGFEQRRQEGSHVTLSHEDGRRVTVPLHKEIKVGTLLSILRQAEIGRDELERLRRNH